MQQAAGTAAAGGACCWICCSVAARRCHGRRLRRRHHRRIASAIRHDVIASDVRGVGGELLYRCVDFAGIVGLQTLDQRVRRGARRAVGPEFVPEARRPQAALSLVEGARISRVGLYLLDQSGNVTGEAVILDRGRGLAEMVAVLDPLRNKGRLGCIVVERRRRGY